MITMNFAVQPKACSQVHTRPAFSGNTLQLLMPGCMAPSNTTALRSDPCLENSSWVTPIFSLQLADPRIFGRLGFRCQHKSRDFTIPVKVHCQAVFATAELRPRRSPSEPFPFKQRCEVGCLTHRDITPRRLSC